ncbi:unnamed protein product [Cladocopium goreaui]|uniref:RING finger protein B (Protein rngB) n=1 Tax=Cladocopium goreaui TaxID=2562237 RepID=A0A9P1BVS8_9DINO|nr:unnamed protein product [Cladocopium goreaui]
MSMAQAPIACVVTSPVSKVTTSRCGPPRLFAPPTPMTAPCGSFAGPPVVWPRSSPTPGVPLPAPAAPLPVPLPVPVVPQTAVLRSAGPVERPIDQAVERPSYRPVSRPAEQEDTAENGARNSTGLRPEQLLLHQLEKEVEKSMEPRMTQSFAPEKTATLPRPPPMLMKAAAARAKQDEDLQQSVFLGAGPGTGSSGFSDSQSSEATSAEPEAEDVTQARRQDRPKRQVPVPPRSKSEENLYLRKNMENLRKQKRHLQQQVESIEARLRNVEAQKLQYQKLFEDSHRSYAIGEGRDLEITGLHQQLAALLMLKDALNSENMELQARIKGLEEEKSRRSPAAACVICMENLANVVCLPCKHLALCSFCSKHSYGERSTCPICRGSITDRMLIYMP